MTFRGPARVFESEEDAHAALNRNEIHKGDVVVVRNENGQERRFKVNYSEVVKGKNVGQNIKLLPGDTILIR